MSANPKRFYGLLFAEFWERFSYFAVLSVLALYLNEQLKLSEGQASAMVGTFGALGYLTPLCGGWLADRVLGNRRTLLVGTVLLILGHAVLVRGSLPATYGAIALLVLGGGLFKPSIISCLGSGFERIDDPKRHAIFRAFYFCVNAAAAAAPIAMSAIQSRLGWPAAFGACALSMIACSFGLLWTRTDPSRASPTMSTDSTSSHAMAGPGVLAILCLPVMAFSAVFTQSSGALIFWSRDRVDLTLGGWLAAPVAPATTCALIPILSVLLLPAVEPLRRGLHRLGLVRSVSGELRFALVVTALSTLVLIVPEVHTPEHLRLSAGWMFASYVLMTAAELLILPVSLSLVAAIAPPQRNATYIGIWYLGVAAGSQLGSEIARLWGVVTTPYYFLLVALIPLCAYGLLLALGSRLDSCNPAR